MSYVPDLHSVAAVEILLEGKDHNHLADVLTDLLDPAGTPRPHLRADKIKHRNLEPVKMPRQAQIEVREINEHCGLRPPLFRFVNDAPEFPANSRKMRDHLGQPYYGDLTGINQEFASGSAHSVAPHAEKFRAGSKLLK